MSLYNMLFGQNPASGILCGMLGKSPYDFGRFRDAYVTERNGEVVIAVYTRNGGGNREHWDEDRDEGPDCGCTGCTITYLIPQFEGYIEDEDDDFDATYATVYMRPPEEYLEILKDAVQEDSPNDNWQEFLGALQDPPKEPKTDMEKRAVSLLNSMPKNDNKE